jgi:hypothetical protein
MRGRTIVALAVLVAATSLLSSCSSDSAAVMSSTLAGAASRLRGSTEKETVVRLEPARQTPYVIVIYPDLRTAADLKVLQELGPKTEAVSPGGAKLAPTLEGFAGELVVWQKGSLVKFSKSFRSVAQAQKVLFAEKPDGSPTLVTLKKEGLEVWITSVQ